MTLLVSGLILYFWQQLQVQQEQHLQDEFQADITEITTKIAERITAYGQILKGGRSLFYASKKVTRQEWHNYVSSLELEQDYPGIQGIGYAVTLPPDQLAAHEKQIRSEGFPAYHVWPEGRRDSYSAIIYLEPFDWRNQRAFGYDMYAQATRHDAMARARDTGQPALTGKVLLVQETNEAPQAGTLLYVPLYKKGAPLQSVKERRQALLGWVYSPYRMDNLIEGMLGHRSHDIRLRIYDRGVATPENLLYDSQPNEDASPASEQILSHRVLSLETAGRTWQLDFDALPAYGSAIGMGSLYMETAGMVLIGLLLIVLTWNLFNTQRKASLLATKLTAFLRESEERWNFALEGSGDGVWDWDIEAGDSFFSPRFRVMLGLDADAPYNFETWRNHIHPDDFERVNDALDRHLYGETPEFAVEHRMQPDDDGYIWVLARAKVTSRAEDGRALRLVGTISDITERKQAEEQIQLLSQAMQQSGEAIVMTDANGIIEYVNTAFSSITGYNKSEAVGQTPRLLNSGMQKKSVYKTMWATILGGGTWHGRVVNRKKDGSFYPAMLTISPISGEAGEITHFVGIQQDLQEYEALEAQFHQSQKMEAVGTLVGGIAHDFNNTLAGITGNLYLAKREMHGHPQAVERLETVEKLSFRAAAMIKQLLTFSRKGTTQMKAVAIDTFLKETLKLHRVSLPENIELRSDISGKNLLVHGDINLLQQVLINLVNNARDAVRSVPDPAIEIRLERYVADAAFKAKHPKLTTENFAHLSVHDNGHGIKEKDIPHIFEPFFTTKGVGEGTGLGLSMVYGAIQSHNGMISIHSDEDKGTTFHIYLPLLPSSENGERLESNAVIERGNGETVLLVDDHEETLATHRDVLVNLGYRVFTAENGATAVELYQKRGREVDLVILDVVMPKMGGKEAFEEIRRINPEARVMFATGYDRLNVLEDKQLRDIPVINKPFVVDALSRAVRALLSS